MVRICQVSLLVVPKIELLQKNLGAMLIALTTQWYADVQFGRGHTIDLRDKGL
jgi:hypothetical protein